MADQQSDDFRDNVKKTLTLAFLATLAYAAKEGGKWLINNGAKHAKDIGAYIINLVKFWKGKSIAIIGPTASGKDHMYSNLRNEDPPKEYNNTQVSEKKETFDIIWPLPDAPDVEFKCRKSMNVGGEIEQRERFWLQACENADIIFYLVDVEKLRDNKENTFKRIREDFKWLGSNMKNFKPSAKIHILLNKIDIFTNGADPDEIEDIIKENTLENVETISASAQKILKDNYGKLSGFTPISMVINIYLILISLWHFNKFIYLIQIIVINEKTVAHTG